MAIRSLAKRILASTAALALMTRGLSALACGPFFNDAVFVYSLHPDLPLRKFAAGTFGIIQPGFARSYLVAAYRYLEDKPFTLDEQNQLGKMWESRLIYDNSSEDAIDKWKEARVKAGMPSADLQIEAFRGFGERAEWGGYKSNFLNCPEDAFTTATATLNGLVRKYGAGSNAVKEWVKAQDMVFAHCSGPQYDYQSKTYSAEPPLPEELASGDATAIQDRAYQVACANFYACNFDQAHKLFEAIANDKSSHWQPYAAYLAARAVLRHATVGDAADGKQLLKEAAASLKEIAAAPGPPGVKSAALNLISYVDAQIDPTAQLIAVSNAIINAHEDAMLVHNVSDLTTLYDSVYGVNDDSGSALPTKTNVPAALQTNDLIDWINTFQSQNQTASVQEALRQWAKKRNHIWLVAAMAHARPQDLTPELSTAAQNIAPSSPAYWTVRYHMIRLALASGDKARARKFMPDFSQAPPSTVNAFHNLNLSLVENLSQFLANGVQTAAGVTTGANGNDFPDDLTEEKTAKEFLRGRPGFITVAADLINDGMPESLLSKIALEEKLPPALKADALQAAFVRAVILGNFDSATRLSLALKAALPKLGRFINEYQKSGSDDEKRFAAASMVLINPGMSPFVSIGTGRPEVVYEMDDYQNNWWCVAANHGQEASDDTTDGANRKIKIANFLTPADKQTAAREKKVIDGQGAGPNFLIKSVMTWARKNPQDPRLPETLYHAIRSPKFSCSDKSTRALSKDAFMFMHAHYPKNEWTVKSKFYYG